MRECPNCGSGRLESFYWVPPVPSHSCLLMDSATRAKQFPAAPIELTFCDACGFIGNALYDESLQAYSTSYEETQHFSAHFSAFAKSLAQRWIEEFELRGKHILEIGCGKGEFLQLMCQLGDNRGTGIDPSCLPQRLDADARQRIEFIRECYSPHHRDIRADAILCRHTLEHVPHTREFLSQIRSTLSDDSNTLLLFEVPDTKRVLRELAYWDIYYEHCSYFTAGSLALLFRQCSFDVVQLERVYDDQYLILAARPSKEPSQPRFPIENELEETREEVRLFQQSIATAKAAWKRRVDELSQRGRTIIWGAGSKCVAFLTTLQLDGQIDYVVDVNPHKQRKYVPGTGHEVWGPNDVRQRPPDSVVVMNPVYREEIQCALAEHDCHPELFCLGQS